jgi:hypothetical protein
LRRFPVFLCVFLAGFGPASAVLGQADYFGNQAVIYSLDPSGGWSFPGGNMAFTYFSLDNGSGQAGFRFTAQQPAPITEVQLFFPWVMGAPGYQVTLETDSGGLPSGTALSAGAFFAPVTGWNRITFPVPAGVTAGNVYHLIVRWNPTSPPLGPSNAATLELSSSPLYGFYPLDGSPDPQLAAEVNPAGGGWATLAEQPVFLVNYSGVWSGNPYSTAYPRKSPSPCWQSFTVPSTIVIDSVGAFAAELTDSFSGPATAVLVWTLQASSSAPVTSPFPSWLELPDFGDVIGTGTLASPGQLGATFSWVDAPTDPITLVPGTEYTLSFEPSGPYSASPRMGYQILIESPGIYENSPDFPIFGEVSYGGSGSHQGNRIEKVCSACATYRDYLDDDIAFRFHIHRVPTPTPTPFPFCDSFHVSKNIFTPGQEPVSITVDYCQCPGAFSLGVYNSAGEFIVSLAQQWITAPLHGTYAWDGKNKSGDVCASGIYVICAVEPLGFKKARILLVR